MELVSGFAQLEAVHQNITNDIQQLESKLLLSFKKDDIPKTLDPMDSDKHRTQAKLSLIRQQQSAVTERFDTFRQQITNLQEEIYLLRQMMKYNNSLDMAYLRSMQPVQFEDIKEHLMSITETPKDAKEYTPQDLADTISRLSVPSMNTKEETVEYLRKELAKSLFEKKLLMEMLSEQEIKMEEQAKVLKTKESVESSLPVKIAHTEKRGVLSIRTGKNEKWQKKYFELTYSPDLGFFVMSYKNKDKKGNISESMALPWAVSKPMEDTKVKTETCFTVTPHLVNSESSIFTSRVWTLSAASSSEMFSWLTVLQLGSSVTPEQAELPILSEKHGFSRILETENAEKQ